MSTITTIASGDLISSSRTDINNNFSNLNTDKMETSVLDTDTTLAASSDLKVATQKAVKTYVDAGGNVNASTTAKGIVEEATQAEVNAGTTTGATGARLFMNPSTNLILQSSTTLTGAQIKLLFSTPITLISGIASKVVVVLSCVAYVDYVSTNFDASSAGTISLVEETSGITMVSNAVLNAEIKTSGSVDYCRTTFPTAILNTTALGKGVQAKLSGNDFTSNADTTIKLTVTYQVVTPQ